MLNSDFSRAEPQIYVWDRFVRVFHWALVAGFTIAYLTEGDLLAVHVWAGYIVGILFVARVLWGFVDPATHVSQISSTIRSRRSAMGVISCCCAGRAISAIALAAAPW